MSSPAYNAIIGSLGVRGATVENNGSNFLVKTNSIGVVDDTLMPIDLNPIKTYYVDTNYDETHGTGTGSPVRPFKTIAEAFAANAAEPAGGSDMTIILNRGSYTWGAAITNIQQNSVCIFSNSPAIFSGVGYAVIDTISFDYTAAPTTRLRLGLHGVQVTGSIVRSGGGSGYIQAALMDGSSAGTVSGSASATNAVYVYPGSTATAVTNVTRTWMVNAVESNYAAESGTNANWTGGVAVAPTSPSSVPVLVNTALDKLVYRVRVNETNLASVAMANVGTGTGTLYRDKAGYTFNFKSIKSGSTKLSVANNADDVTLDVAEANIVHGNISGIGTNSHTTIDSHLAAAAPHTGHAIGVASVVADSIAVFDGVGGKQLKAGAVIGTLYKVMGSVDDTTPGYLNAKVQNSITVDVVSVPTSPKLHLSGDASAPGASMLYGTNGAGVKGWYAQGDPAGTAAGLISTHSTVTYVHSDISLNTAARHARSHVLSSGSDHTGNLSASMLPLSGTWALTGPLAVNDAVVTFNTVPACAASPNVDADLVNKAYADSVVATTWYETFISAQYILTTAIAPGAVTAVVVDLLSDSNFQSIPSTGMIRVTNSSLDTQDFIYSAKVEGGSTISFTVQGGPTTAHTFPDDGTTLVRLLRAVPLRNTIGNGSIILTVLANYRKADYIPSTGTVDVYCHDGDDTHMQSLTYSAVTRYDTYCTFTISGAPTAAYAYTNTTSRVYVAGYSETLCTDKQTKVGIKSISGVCTYSSATKLAVSLSVSDVEMPVLKTAMATLVQSSAGLSSVGTLTARIDLSTGVNLIIVELAVTGAAEEDWAEVSVLVLGDVP